MTKIRDLTGQRFGRLTVVKHVGIDKFGHHLWECKCDCDNVCKVTTGDLRTKHKQSCGCLLIESRTKHGDSKTRLYKIWIGVRERCLNSNRKEYKHYGGRGITICDEWLDFLIFKKWSIVNNYSDILSIDRINNNGNYCPENCKWSTNKEQNNNKRNTIFLTYNNETKKLNEWAEEKGIGIGTLKTRLNRGWENKDIFNPINQTGHSNRTLIKKDKRNKI